MRFSKRKGYVSARDTIQANEIDDALRNKLWNAFKICILDAYEEDRHSSSLESSNLYRLFQRYWHHLFKLPIDDMPYNFDTILLRLREHYFKSDWFEVYDLIEFTAENCPDDLSDQFVEFCNEVLKSELSAYRFIDLQLTNITTEDEIECIDEAINSPTKYSNASEHLKTALGFLSDRKSPDYRNSIKESISAVESLCKVITDDTKATLGSALNKIEKSHNLHPAFKTALSNLYGYTNDSGGIRHSLLDQSSLTYSDAKFMLVSCSAFINYIIGKESEIS